ncbi:MAG: hypothetical protein ACFFB0_20570 [Promethearchaeota archaeon]
MNTKNFKSLVLFLFVISTLCLTIGMVPIRIYISGYDTHPNLTISNIEKPQIPTTNLWTEEGVVICQTNNTQHNPQIISDGAGGAIIVWEHYHANFTVSDIHAQKINSTGDVQWEGNGTAICTANGKQRIFYDYWILNQRIISDGAGGAIIVWEDCRSNITVRDIYAQRVNSKGDVLWDDNGTAICTASGDQSGSQIISDGDGGAIIVWQDERNGDGKVDVYAQRINSKGDVLWNDNGIAIITSSDYLSNWNPQICSDGDGGAIIVWAECIFGHPYKMDGWGFFAQRVNSAGNVQWKNEGMQIYFANKHNQYHQICSDGIGGAIITWMEWRKGCCSDIFAQKINSSGDIQWGINGTDICRADDLQYIPIICTDGEEGAIIAWQDYRSGRLDRDIYAQRVDSKGKVQWTVNGEAICTTYDYESPLQICSDGKGGAFIVWEKTGRKLRSDISMQRIDFNGTVQWTIDGISINTGNYNKSYPAVCSDGTEGVIITWADDRNMNRTEIDIYAQRIIEQVPYKKKRWISFGSYYLLLTILGFISSIIVIKQKIKDFK